MEESEVEGKGMRQNEGKEARHNEGKKPERKAIIGGGMEGKIRLKSRKKED